MTSQNLPLITVVIPMFNVAKHINQCVDSVLSQSFKNFELICVDDGCSDATLDLLAEYNDQRLRIIRQTNRGCSGARNTGIFAARGFYVALLDADDFWASDKLSQHINHLNARPDIDISFSPSLLVTEQGEELDIGQVPLVDNITFKNVLCRNPIGNGSAPVIRKQALLAHAYPLNEQGRLQIFNESLGYAGDIELWLRMSAKKSKCLEGITAPLTFNRLNKGNNRAQLNRKYIAWVDAVNGLRTQTELITPAIFSLAKAYQLRYLAAQAIQSGSAWSALKLVHKALLCNPKILVEETSQTALTYICAFLAIAPSSMYKLLESYAKRYICSRTLHSKI